MVIGFFWGLFKIDILERAILLGLDWFGWIMRSDVPSDKGGIVLTALFPFFLLQKLPTSRMP
jgi:hypothetical protein